MCAGDLPGEAPQKTQMTVFAGLEESAFKELAAGLRGDKPCGREDGSEGFGAGETPPDAIVVCACNEELRKLKSVELYCE